MRDGSSKPSTWPCTLTALLVAWMTRNSSTVLRELLDVVRRYASR